MGTAESISSFFDGGKTENWESSKSHLDQNYLDSEWKMDQYIQEQSVEEESEGLRWQLGCDPEIQKPPLPSISVVRGFRICKKWC